MTEFNQDFEMVAGDTKVLEITNIDEDGDPLPLTGATIKWVLALNEETGTPLLIEKDNGVSGGIVVTDEAGGIFEVTLDPADTVGLYGEYFHEAEVIISGAVSSVTKGFGHIYRQLIPNTP